MTHSPSPLHGSLFDVPPRRAAPLDPGFRPLALGLRAFRQALSKEARRELLRIALERPNGAVARLDVELFPEACGRDADNLRCAAWSLDGLLWSRGGFRVLLDGPEALCGALAAAYRPGGSRAFDAELMARAYLRPFTVEGSRELPEARELGLALGGHLEGCRIGFDLGASDYKVAAVVEGTAVFSAELPWEPRTQSDPAYHLAKLEEGLRLAASHLPRVDAIGGSSAGILVDSEVRVASLFRAVPPERFEAEVCSLFPRLRRTWGVPLEVLNDGDVTALAGALSLGTRGILGIAMGSSEAAGFLDGAGRVTGWLNELAFSPVDAHPAGGSDDWSGRPGIGAGYFSQQAVARLAPKAGLRFPDGMSLPERLAAVQARAEAGDGTALSVFDSIGVFLGYTLPLYAEQYGMAHAMILGRVSSGAGGELILKVARRILEEEFPELAAHLHLFLPDERSRRVGQAVAAASLPALGDPR